MNDRYKTMTNPYNDNRYRKKAVKLGKLSRETLYNNSKSHYSEEAGDYWLKQAKASSKVDPIDMKNCLYHALHAYGRAEKLSGKENNNERMGKKKASVESKIESLIKKRSDIKTGDKRLTSRNRLEKITSSNLILPVFSMIAFSLALVFSSFSMTGFAINQSSILLPNYIALAFFMVGFILAITYFRKEKNPKKYK